MSRAQGDSEFVETAFTAEEVGEAALPESSEAGGESCAFLKDGRQPPLPRNPMQQS